MVGLSFLGNLLPSVGYLERDKVIQHLPPVLSGIVLCSIVYKLTGFISLRCFKAYGYLSKEEKLEWNNRGFSTVHAIIAAFTSFYLLIISDLFQEDSHDRLIVDRTSSLSNTILGISTGYFLSDMAMILWHFPVLGGLEYILHHELSMFAIVLSLLSGKAQTYILMVLFTESTTPFVNLRWYLDVASKKNSTLYTINGVALFLGWLIARVLLFVYFFIHILAHFDQLYILSYLSLNYSTWVSIRIKKAIQTVKTIFPLGFYTVLVVPSVLSILNLFWFWKITKGLIKTLSKAKPT